MGGTEARLLAVHPSSCCCLSGRFHAPLGSCLLCRLDFLVHAINIQKSIYGMAGGEVVEIVVRNIVLVTVDVPVAERGE